MSMPASINGRATREPEPDEAPTAATERDEEELRKFAIASLKRKHKFVENALGYVTVNGILWLIWLLSGRAGDGVVPWPAWVSVIWGFFLAMDAWRAYGRWPRSLRRAITEADIEREMQRARERATRRA